METEFETLLKNNNDKKCEKCKKVPKIPALCLFCKKLICMNSNCCSDKSGSKSIPETIQVTKPKNELAIKLFLKKIVNFPVNFLKIIINDKKFFSIFKKFTQK